MSRHFRDLITLLGEATYTDNYGVYGSDFTVCRYCDNESGAGVLGRENWHAPKCPIPRLEKKYSNQLYRKRQP